MLAALWLSGCCSDSKEGSLKEVASGHGISEVVLLTVVEPARSAAVGCVGASQMEALDTRAKGPRLSISE